jgi:peptidyl-tRNA hydrolase
MAIENHHDLSAAALVRAAQEDPYVMHIVVRRASDASAEELCASVIRATLDCVERYEHDEAHAEMFAQWFALSFRKVTLRAKEGEWARLLEEFDGALDEDRVFVLPPVLRSSRDKFLAKLQVFNVELPDLAQELPPGPLGIVINQEAGMSLGKALAQASHSILILLRALSREGALFAAEIAAWEAEGRPVALSSAPRARFEQIAALDHVARVRDAGITEVAPGTHTVICVPPGMRLP